MASVILLSLAVAISNTLNDLALSRQSLHSDAAGKMPFYGLASLFSLALSALLMLIQFGFRDFWQFTQTDIFYGLLTGLLSFGTFFSYINSFTPDSTTIPVTIFRMNFIPTIILAFIIFSDTLSVRRILAILICIVSIALFSSWDFRNQKNIHSLLYSLSAMLFGSSLNIVNKLAVQQGGIPGRMLIWRFLMVILATLLCMARQRNFRINPGHVKYAAVSGTFYVLSVFFYMAALKVGELSVIQSIMNLSIVFVALISWLFYGERLPRRKLLGVICAVGTVVLIV